MSANAEIQQSGADPIKWAVVVLLIAAAVVGNSFYSEQATFIRVLGVLALGGIAAFIAASTTKGKIALVFAKEARTEVRKVVWPTRQETIQTTLYILAITTVMGLLLMFMDWILVDVVAFLTGQGG